VPGRELRLDDALDIDPEAEVGGFVEEPMESVAFGRIAAQQAKQVIVQKVREAERAQVVEQYKDRVGSWSAASSSASTATASIVDLGGNAEGVHPRERHDPARDGPPQDRIKAFLKEVRPSRAARSCSCRAPRRNS
jgi:N utilization substance protein A